tara:strand:- start:9844 stop:9945 length:102 start_codon:yes stop_codon:yes gene_type:complete
MIGKQLYQPGIIQYTQDYNHEFIGSTKPSADLH